MGKKKVLALIVTAMLTFNMGTAALATNNEVIHLNNSGTRKEGAAKPIVQVNISDSYEKVCENEKLELYLNEKTLGLKVKNKETGYVWSSTIDEEQEGLNQIWQGIADSGITIEFMNEKGKVEKSSISNGKVSTKVDTRKDGFDADINFKNEGIQFKLNVTLKDDSIDVGIKNDSLKESKEKIQLQSIYLYPFMGATHKQDISGYMFVPDGSGALIRLEEKNEVITEPYINRIYGSDYGIKGFQDGEMLINEVEKIKYPVFGMVHNVNENGFVAVVESGAEYGEINAYPSGVTTDFNWITSKFIIRESYFQPTNKKGDGMVVNQKEANKFDISVSYNFLSGDDANYVGMAKQYQSNLVAAGVLTKNEKQNQDIPVKLEFLMSENQKGLIGKKVIEMTTAEQVKEMTSQLIDEGLLNLNVVVRGWTKGGVSGSALNHFPFEKKVGSSSEWKKLIKELKEQNIDVSMYTDYLKGYSGTKGFSETKDSAQTIAEQIIKGKYMDYSFVAPRTAKEFFEDEQSKFEKYGINNIAIDSIGDNLYSNFNSKNKSTRSEGIELQTSMLEEGEVSTSLYEPNDYLWKYTNGYYGIPMSSSNYLVLTDNVPFLQIALKGYIDFYAPELNFEGGSRDILLQMIDYGAYPSFFVTEEDSVKLMDTNSSWLYTSKFEIWKDEIIEQYNVINSALKNVEGETIISRNILSDGVVEVGYSNGVKIVVNYNEATFDNNGLIVEGKDFKVIGGN